MATGMNLTLGANAVYTTLSNMCLNLRIDPHDLGNFAKYYSMFVKDVEPYAQYYRIINTDTVGTYAFTGDTNILSVTYPPVTEDKVELDKFRQLEVSYEHFRSKAAFGTATMFSDFVSSVTAWVEDTFKLFMGSTVNQYLGSITPTNAKGVQTVTLSQDASGAADFDDQEAIIRLQAGEIAQGVQAVLDEMKDARTDYNELGYTRTTPNPIIIWNEEVVRKILKKGLQGNSLYQSPDFNFENTMPARFFQTAAGSTSTTASNKTIRSAIEQTISGKHYFAGELLANSLTSLTAANNYTAIAEGSAPYGGDIACLILDPEAVIVLHGETSDTAFENQKAHINTAWKTWSYGLGRDKGKAFVKVKLAFPEP